MRSRHMSIKELGKRKLSKEDKLLAKRIKRADKMKKYHKAETQLVLWSYPKMLLVKCLVPWRWKLAYYPATRSKATGAQMTLTEKGKGERKKNGEAYRAVLHRGESRILQLEKGYMAASEELMGKGLAYNYAVRIVVRKKRK